MNKIKAGKYGSETKNLKKKIQDLQPSMLKK